MQDTPTFKRRKIYTAGCLSIIHYVLICRHCDVYTAMSLSFCCKLLRKVLRKSYQNIHLWKDIFDKRFAFINDISIYEPDYFKQCFWMTLKKKLESTDMKLVKDENPIYPIDLEICKFAGNNPPTKILFGSTGPLFPLSTITIENDIDSFLSFKGDLEMENMVLLASKFTNNSFIAAVCQSGGYFEKMSSCISVRSKDIPHQRLILYRKNNRVYVDPSFNETAHVIQIPFETMDIGFLLMSLCISKKSLLILVDVKGSIIGCFTIHDQMLNRHSYSIFETDQSIPIYKEKDLKKVQDLIRISYEKDECKETIFLDTIK